MTAKCHAHLQTLTKTSAKFQKDWTKIVGGAVVTRNPVSICFGRSWTKLRKKGQKLI